MDTVERNPPSPAPEVYRTVPKPCDLNVECGHPTCQRRKANVLALVKKLTPEELDEWKRWAVVLHELDEKANDSLEFKKEFGEAIAQAEIFMDNCRTKQVLAAFQEEHPPALEECPLCCETFPLAVKAQYVNLPCCGKQACGSCFDSFVKKSSNRLCPFCRYDLLGAMQQWRPLRIHAFRS